MLYLAEVHKKSGFMGVKTELKLLARQQSEQNWGTLPGEEMIPSDIANEYSSGVLVLVEMDGNQQIKKVQDATRHLVGILKNFSKMREKFRTQEEEIEGWKQSLIYQSQELTRREVDIEARTEELQQLDAESQKIEAQRQEFEATRTQILKLKEEIEGDRQQLEEAWGRLHSAQQQLDQDQRLAVLTDDQVHHLEGLIGRLEANLFNQDTIRQPLQTLRSCGDEQQAVLQRFWDQFDQERGQIEPSQGELEQQTQDLAQAWEQWHRDRDGLQQLQESFNLQKETLALKQVQRDWLSQQIQGQVEIEKGLQGVRNGISGDFNVDIGQLHAMPLEELEATVDKLQKELVKLSRFVADQEEELKLQDQTIEELKTRIETASEYDRLSLASDLEDEQQNYQLLENTLQGQRQTLKDRNSVLKLHQGVLNQRKGVAPEDDNNLTQQIDPLLAKVGVQKKALQDALQSLEEELTQLQDSLQQLQAQVDAMATATTQRRAELEQQGPVIAQRRLEVGQQKGRVDTLQQSLQPIQDQLTHLHQSLDHLWTPLESAAAEQEHVAAELKQTIVSLGQVKGV